MVACLVTGATGFIGGSVIERALSLGMRVQGTSHLVFVMRRNTGGAG